METLEFLRRHFPNNLSRFFVLDDNGNAFIVGPIGRKGYFDIQMCISADETNFRNVKIWFDKSGSGLTLIHDFADNIRELAISPANDLIYSSIIIGSQVENSTEEDIIDYTKQRSFDTGNITEKNEFVMLLKGSAVLSFEGEKNVMHMKPGDYIKYGGKTIFRRM